MIERNIEPVGLGSAGQLAGRLVGAVWGHLIGDAVGLPYEGRPAADIETVRIGVSGAHSQLPWTWGDDGALMLALLDSLTSVGFEPEDQAQRILGWYRRAAYTPGGDGRFDVSKTTRQAIHAFEAGTPAERCGPTEERAAGNGSLMRILPLALAERAMPDPLLVDHARRASRVTDGTEHAQVACSLYALVARELLDGETPPHQALSDGQARLRAVYEASPGSSPEGPAMAALRHLERWNERHGTQAPWDSFWSAWDAFAGASSYLDTIERAIRYGNDTDTVAALAGGLAGAHWGLAGIPTAWLTNMRGRGVAGPLIDRLLSGGNLGPAPANPLTVAWVDLDSVPGFRDWPGRLGLTLLPGQPRDGRPGVHWRDLETDAERLRSVETVDSLVLLALEHELQIVRGTGFVEVMGRHGIEVIRSEIPALDVPADRVAFRQTLGDIAARLRAGRSVAVACDASQGRSTMTIACLLREAGLEATAALALANASRTGSIDDQLQDNFVRAWTWPEPIAAFR